MPIRPENRARYPKNWPAIRDSILRRALWRCEWPGCTALHRDVGWWRGEVFVPMGRALRDAGAKAGEVAADKNMLREWIAAPPAPEREGDDK